MRFPRECNRADCAFSEGPTASTCMSFQQIYDKHGNPQVADPNTMTTSVCCQSCKREWTRVEEAGNTHFVQHMP